VVAPWRYQQEKKQIYILNQGLKGQSETEKVKKARAAKQGESEYKRGAKVKPDGKGGSLGAHVAQRIRGQRGGVGTAELNGASIRDAANEEREKKTEGKERNYSQWKTWGYDPKVPMNRKNTKSSLNT